MYVEFVIKFQVDSRPSLRWLWKERGDKLYFMASQI